MARRQVLVEMAGLDQRSIATDRPYGRWSLRTPDVV